jgi:HAMP domain-containing protein
MKLLARFNLIFIAIFGAGGILVLGLAYVFLRNDAKEQIFEQAKLMMETTVAVRSYTSGEIEPLLNRLQKQAMAILPQTVPAYSATQVFAHIHKQNPDYSYKEATLNPTNLADRANDWESDVVNAFRNDPARSSLNGERDTPTGRSMFYARPIKVVDPACLDCHSTSARAPRALVRQYTSEHGFGWKLNEIVGAQIVSVPEALSIDIADRELKRLVAYLFVLALVALGVLDAVLIVTVIRPVANLSRVTDEISQGKMDVEDIAVTGHDEISVLAASFNRMKRSLTKAIRLLESRGT